MPDQPPAPETFDDRVLFGALLGFAVMSLMQLTGVDEQDRGNCFYGSLCCFAVAVPMLAACLIRSLGIAGRTPRPPWRNGVGSLAGLILVAGIDLAAFHLSYVAGGLFLGGCLLAFALAKWG